jgi:hypothetical protein
LFVNGVAEAVEAMKVIATQAIIALNLIMGTSI